MKRCTKCKCEKSKTEFSKNCCKRDGLQDICRPCSKFRSRRYYKENSNKHKQYVNDRRIRILNDLCVLKVSLGCCKCTESHVATLDFHHKNPDEKEICISTAITKNGWSKERVMEEVKKCVVMCSNCHRKLEWELRLKAKKFNVAVE